MRVVLAFLIVVLAVWVIVMVSSIPVAAYRSYQTKKNDLINQFKEEEEETD